MPILPRVGRRAWSVRATVALLYVLLAVLSVTMVVPFMITVSSSICNDFDYERFWPVPRYLWSRQDRFVKGLVGSFNTYSYWYTQMACRFRDVPPHWTSWREIGRDVAGVDALAQPYLEAPPEEQARWRVMAADYAAFVETYPVEDTVCALVDVKVAGFLKEKYARLWAEAEPERAASASADEREDAALALLGETWGIPFKTFYAITFLQDMRQPMWQQTWFPPPDPKFADFEVLKAAYRDHAFTPGIRRKWLAFLESRGRPAAPVRVQTSDRADDVFPIRTDSPADLRDLWVEFKGRVAPAAPTTPFAMRAVWRRFLDSEEVQAMVGLAPGQPFDAAVYNRLAGTDYASLYDTPFPVPADAPEGIARLWAHFVRTRYPLRLTAIEPTEDLRARFHEFLRGRFKTLKYANSILGTARGAWEDFDLAPRAPEGRAGLSLRSVWVDFVKDLPPEDRILTSSEHAWQAFLLRRYGSLDAVNRAYGTAFARIEEAFPPFDKAYAVTFLENETALALGPLTTNYGVIADYLFRRSPSVLVTFALVALAVLCTLTINPMAAYALSRFDLRGKEKVILFLLATMAFPAMVSAIPAYLLMRDLGLLNTFLALVLPGAANGMAIFILKGFFDSLPRELYEAATIDGAREWQIFWVITLPMMKPILAINALGAFLWAYTSWEWALIICQKESMWTIMVWLYQANQWWVESPWIVTAGFVVASVPTLLVFLFCQKIILRGIIIPQMK